MTRSALLWLVPLVWACSSLPEVREASLAEHPKLLAACQVAYPQGDWAVVHSILITLPGGGRSALLGITASEAEEGCLSSVLLAPEGIVLFKGSSCLGAVKVERALPPLDRDGFAHGLFADVHFIFLPPAGEPSFVGRTAGLEPICRWESNGLTQDLLPNTDGSWKRREYEDGRLQREVASGKPGAGGFAPVVDLERHGMAGYKMRFLLVEEAAP